MTEYLSSRLYRRRPKPKLFRTILIIAAGSTIAMSSAAHAATPCEHLPAVTLENAQVTASTMIPGPIITTDDGQTHNDVPSFCKVSVVATPTPDSLINIEVWMPAAHWNGRFQGVGNGGYAGTIALGIPAMVAGLQRGFAVATTDMGTAPSVNSNADVLIGHPQKWVDWGSRSTHLMTVISKQLVASYYGQPARYSYFNGCSTGGQQGLMSAQRYPADYDGILAGAPAHNRTHVHTAIVWNNRALRETLSSSFSSSQAKLVTDSVVAACAVKTGGLSTDNFLTDPRACDWDPGVLQCTSDGATNCLNADQVKAARKIYAGARNPVTGRLIFPGSAKGSESESQFGWVAQGRNEDPPFSSLFKWVFGPTWLARTYDFDEHMSAVDSLLASTLNANNPDLSQFKARGGKIIGYHGWGDPLIAPQDFVNYYLRVISAQSPSSTQGLKRTQEFFRLFMVPGMSHCAFGPGPNAFGNRFSGLVVTPPPVANDAANDAMVALQEWVEKGMAPSRIIATKYVQDQPDLGIQMSRPLCPYPQIARYSGSGNPNSAASFSCVDNQYTVNPMPGSEYLQ